MHKFIINKNNFLKQNIQGYYHTNYIGWQYPGNPDYLNIFKNTYNSYSTEKLEEAYEIAEDILFHEIYEIYNKINEYKITVCVVPRSKTYFKDTQLYFSKAVSYAIASICYEYDIIDYKSADCDNRIEDGVDFIKRNKNTYTTHINNPKNFINDGPKPYPGITKDTCHISPEVKGKHILLIDDIYTKNVNIDKDAIQALLDNGAASVTFYAVAKTISRKYYEELLEEKRLAEEARHNADIAEWLRQDEMGAWGREKNRD